MHAPASGVLLRCLVHTLGLASLWLAWFILGYDSIIGFDYLLSFTVFEK